jgi:hypothetical protein
MIPFHSRFPDLAARETRCLHVLQSGGALPVGEYGFIELYCEDPRCDCRRVLLQVRSAQAPDTVLATINYGWESTEFYTRRLHGDAQAGGEIADASLDPVNTQSRHAEVLLDLFRDVVRNDPAYVARLARHYEMFKAARPEPMPTAPVEAAPKSDQLSNPPMTVSDILQQLRHVPDRADFAPYEAALRAAIEQREALTPELIAAIDRVSADPAHYLESHEDCLHIFAIYLLAQFREPRALDCFLRFFSLPKAQALDLTGDVVTEHGAAVLASVCNGDPAPLRRLIHHEAVNEFVRGQAIDALAVQSLWGQRPREAVIEELRQLFHTLPKPGNAYLWAVLMMVICDFHAPELYAEARGAFTEGLVDASVVDLDHLEKDLFQLGEQCFTDFRQRNAPIDAVAECSCWLCFRDEEEEREAWDEEDGVALEPPSDDVSRLPPEGLPDLRKPTPFVAPRRVGRNDPCPCGSGNKYKKCCGKN